MTQEQKQFIIKALQTGIPAIAKDPIDALEEVARIADTKQEELDGQEQFQFLDQEIFNITIKALQGSAPFMAEEYCNAYSMAVNVCLSKFSVNAKAREEREKAEAEARKSDEPASDKRKSA